MSFKKKKKKEVELKDILLTREDFADWQKEDIITIDCSGEHDVDIKEVRLEDVCRASEGGYILFYTENDSAVFNRKLSTKDDLYGINNRSRWLRRVTEKTNKLKEGSQGSIIC
jgi:hypothetical protein